MIYQTSEIERINDETTIYGGKMELGEEGSKWAKFASCKGRSFCQVANLCGHFTYQIVRLQRTSHTHQPHTSQ